MDELNWKQEYIKEDFSVDNFLSKHIQNSDVETLRKELKDHALKLHRSMSNNLKTKTEAIINLVEHLTNLGVKINELSSPCFQFHEEIRSLFDLVKNAEKSYESYLDNVEQNNKKREQLQMKLLASENYTRIHTVIDQIEESTDDLTLVERAVNEYAFQRSYVIDTKLNYLNDEVNVNEIISKLKIIIDDKFIGALNHCNEHTLVCCLRMYINLQLQNEAENLYKEKIVLPALKKIFTKQNLEKHQHNLDDVFTEALNFLNHDMKIIHEILRRNLDLKGYDFIINSYWKAVDKLLQDNLSDVTAPGNPELFQKRFQDTWNFLQAIVERANNPNLIYEPSFLEHFKRFNLRVYFEIRFQQISYNLESEILKCSDIQTIVRNSGDSQFKLNVTSVLWRCIDMCYHPEVFLCHLSDQFVKCSMLLLSRYICWLEKALEPSSRVYEIEVFLVNALVDLSILKESLGFPIKDFIHKSIYRIIPQKMWPFVQKIIDTNETSLNDAYKKVQAQLIALKVKQSGSTLQQVGSIPRLYRRTNRNVPKEPSSYIVEAVAPIVIFHSVNKQSLERVIPFIADTCIAKIGEQYLSLVQEVLLSVCKTEESLRRLKNRNLGFADDTAQINNELTSDEAKIRDQIKLDVGYFIHQLSPISGSEAEKVMQTLAEESGYAV